MNATLILTENMENMCASASALRYDNITEVSAALIQMPNVKEDCGYLKNGATKPPERHHQCQACSVKHIHYIPQDKEVEKSNNETGLLGKRSIDSLNHRRHTIQWQLLGTRMAIP